MMETLLDVLRSLFLGRACSRDLLRNDSVDPGMPGVADGDGRCSAVRIQVWSPGNGLLKEYIGGPFF